MLIPPTSSAGRRAQSGRRSCHCMIFGRADLWLLCVQVRVAYGRIAVRPDGVCEIDVFVQEIDGTRIQDECALFLYNISSVYTLCYDMHLILDHRHRRSRHRAQPYSTYELRMHALRAAPKACMDSRRSTTLATLPAIFLHEDVPSFCTVVIPTGISWRS